MATIFLLSLKYRDALMGASSPFGHHNALNVVKSTLLHGESYEGPFR